MLPRELWTIGHSVLSIEAFLELLEAHRIQALVDVRKMPGSKRHPQFNGPTLAESLASVGIQYIHMPDLGGLRKPRPDSPNSAWRNVSFRGYADYMMTPPFAAAAEQLLEIASRKRTAMMCAEAVWWQCHRAMISDYAKAKGAKVLHIMGEKKVDEHPYTAPARLVNGHLTYGAEKPLELFQD
jgi:uncharacterized protein (DUF488 family)